MDQNNNFVSVSGSDDVETCRKKFSGLGAKVRVMVERRQEVYRKLDSTRREIHDLTHDLPSLESLLASASLQWNFDSEDSHLKWFHPGVGQMGVADVKNCMEDVQKSIQKHLYQFEKPPLGPLYTCIAVTDEKWSGLVEKILEPYLFMFLVDNLTDLATLKSLMSDVIPTASFTDPFDVTRLHVDISMIGYSEKYRPRESRLKEMPALDTYNAKSLMEVIKFPKDYENPWKTFIGNHLDGEEIFLFTSEHDAFVLMQAQANITPPALVKLGYSLDGFQIFPFPLFKTSELKVPKNASFIKADSTIQIRDLKEYEGMLLGDLDILERGIEALREAQMTALDDYESAKECKMLAKKIELTKL